MTPAGPAINLGLPGLVASGAVPLSVAARGMSSQDRADLYWEAKLIERVGSLPTHALDERGRLVRRATPRWQRRIR